MPLDAMMDATRELPRHVLAAVRAVNEALSAGTPFHNAAVIGMGGSSIGGALATRLLERKAPIPLSVIREHHVPGFVDEDTFVVATSYSGNTAETLDATRAAAKRGATLAAVTTGGKLGPLVEDAGGTVIHVPVGYQPRAAAGWLFGANFALLDTVMELDRASALRTAAKQLEDRVDTLVPEGGSADEIASSLGEGPIGVVGHGSMGTIARRWAAEISENAKRLAFHAELPEMAHNQIVGWDGEPGDATLVVLRTDQERPLETARLAFLAERAEQAGATVVEAPIKGAGLAAVLEAVLLGDAVSLHLARREGIDPEPVDVIDDLKQRLAESG